MKLLGRACLLALLAWLTAGAWSQVIEFESGGLQYQTLTRGGVTVMFAHLPTQVRRYGIVQVAVTNGSAEPCAVRPVDFRFEYGSGNIVYAVPAGHVINQLVRNASGNDVIKLVTTYEMGLYGMQRSQSSNGYEQRRQSALAVVSSKRLKAAAAASAIALVETELQPGESTDGAIFYPIVNRPEGDSILRVTTAGQEFEFDPARPGWMTK